ncbi:hypothetical protein CRUP_038776 [Coryphaenoides rupestris]|nr:hypothetical protein CRUP_038776 [Coryphaenoides rupestris]
MASAPLMNRSASGLIPWTIWTENIHRSHPPTRSVKIRHWGVRKLLAVLARDTVSRPTCSLGQGSVAADRCRSTPSSSSRARQSTKGGQPQPPIPSPRMVVDRLSTSIRHWGVRKLLAVLARDTVSRPTCSLGSFSSKARLRGRGSLP